MTSTATQNADTAEPETIGSGYAGAGSGSPETLPPVDMAGLLR